MSIDLLQKCVMLMPYLVCPVLLILDLPVPLFHESEVPVAVTDVAQASAKVPVLCKVIDITRLGWPSRRSDDKILPYFKICRLLSLSANCLLFAHRVVIIRSKMVARTYFWWESMGKDIETLCKFCPECNAINSKKEKPNLIPWPKCKFPFQRVQISLSESAY